MNPLRVEVFVYTYKEGALSALAHDLKLRVDRCEVHANDDRTSVRAWFDASSLRVVCAMRDGREAPGALPRVVHGEIERNIVRDVLRARTFPRIELTSSSIEDTRVTAALTLCGVTRDVVLAREGNVARVRIDQRDFGIAPFSAMLGTLKIKPHVDVEVRVTG